MMLCIGLTGGVASGKSSIAGLFADLGAALISADHIARQITEPGQNALAAIEQHFGHTIILEDGRLNRRKLREVILNDDTQRNWLEQLLHPIIRAKIVEAIAQITHHPYCIVEIPLLKNRQDYPYLQRILMVKSDRKTQVLRLIERDNCSISDAEKLIDTQEKSLISNEFIDDVIINNLSLELIKKEIEVLHLKYLQLAVI